MSISSVVVRGYLAGVNFIPTRGYTPGKAAAPITGGHFLPGKKGKHTLSNIQVLYNKAKSLERKETKELRDIVSEFVEPQLARQPVLPDFNKINYQALAINDLAYDKFSQALETIQERLALMEQQNNVLLAKQQEEDDELLLMAVIASMIH